MIRRGSKAPRTVRRLQTALGKLGYKTAIDGVFGQALEDAVMKFQRENELKVDGRVGFKTQAEIDRQLSGKGDQDDAPETKPNKSQTGAPWMEWCKPYIGQREIRGRRDNGWISGLWPLAHIGSRQHDEVAWCATLVGAALESTGHRGTRSGSAASYDRFGKPCYLKYGAIVTIRRKGGSGRHVAFFSHLDRRGNVVLLGGNQGDQLRYATFSKAKIASIRWPS